MKVLKASELKELSVTELNAKIDDYKKDLFECRFKQAVGELENPTQMRTIRKSIAVIKTVIREKELGR